MDKKAITCKPLKSWQVKFGEPVPNVHLVQITENESFLTALKSIDLKALKGKSFYAFAKPSVKTLDSKGNKSKQSAQITFKVLKADQIDLPAVFHALMLAIKQYTPKLDNLKAGKELSAIHGQQLTIDLAEVFSEFTGRESAGGVKLNKLYKAWQSDMETAGSKLSRKAAEILAEDLEFYLRKVDQELLDLTEQEVSSTQTAIAILRKVK